MTKVAIIGAGPCGLSMLRSFEQAKKKDEIHKKKLRKMLRRMVEVKMIQRKYGKLL